MILLDAYVVIAYFQADPNAGPAVRNLLASHRRAAISAINVGEVVDHRIRVRGVDPEEAVLDLEQLELDVKPVDDSIGVRAGLLRARHYHSRRRPVSFADCVAAATLLADDDLDALATADAHLLELVHEEGGGVHPLPDSTGAVWTAPA